MNVSVVFDVEQKGRFYNLLITVNVMDFESGDPVSGAVVDMDLDRTGAHWDYRDITGETGAVTFKLKHARTNTAYTATVTGVDDGQGGTIHPSVDLDDCAQIVSGSIASC